MCLTESEQIEESKAEIPRRKASQSSQESHAPQLWYHNDDHCHQPCGSAISQRTNSQIKNQIAPCSASFVLRYLLAGEIFKDKNDRTVR
jgi:hypothetical protein